MIPDILTSGIGEITLNDGLVHVTLMAASPDPGQRQRPVHELVLPPGGFLQFANHLTGLIRNLEQQAAARGGNENA